MAVSSLFSEYDLVMRFFFVHTLLTSWLYMQDLDLEKPAVQKFEPKNMIETTTAEVLEKADFRVSFCYVGSSIYGLYDSGNRSIRYFNYQVAQMCIKL